MADLALASQRADIAGDTVIGKAFTKATRPVGGGSTGLEKGDILLIPNDYDVREGNFGQFIFVQIDGTDDVKPFFPSIFHRSYRVANEDGTLTRNRVSASGTAVDLYASVASVEECMNQLKGKKIIVSEMTPVKTVPYGRSNVEVMFVPTIDIYVEERKGNNKKK